MNSEVTKPGSAAGRTLVISRIADVMRNANVRRKGRKLGLVRISLWATALLRSAVLGLPNPGQNIGPFSVSLPFGDHFCHPLWLRSGEVMGFGPVLFKIIELPFSGGSFRD